MHTQLATVLAAAALAAAALPALAGEPSAPVVISQVYGGGGNTAALFTNDFIELHNRSSNVIDIIGWSVQYAGAGGSSWQVTSIPTGTLPLQPGQFYLIQQAAGNNTSLPQLPTPDATGTINMSGTAAKVALVSTSVVLTGTCDDIRNNASLVDLVGYGTANCFEGAATAATSNTTAAIRNADGCTDTNNNSADFTIAAPTPRNSATTILCTGATPPSGIGSTDPAQLCRNQNVTLFVAVSEGNPASAITQVTGDTSNLGGGPGLIFLDNGAAPDATAGDNIYTAQTTVGPAVGFFSQNVPVSITDQLARIGIASVAVNVVNCEPRGFGQASPAGVCTGSASLLTVNVSPGLNPPSSGLQVIADLSAIGGSGNQAFFDDGTNGDAAAGDSTFSYLAAVPAATAVGPYTIGVTIFDEQARVGLSTFPITAVTCTDSGADLVISQVYGGGGNAGSVLTHDFVELFNRGDSAIDLAGMSLQRASNSGTFVTKVDLTGSIAPGRYFLIQLAAQGGGTTPLPTPDQQFSPADALTLGATSGRVALVSDTTLLGADCAAATTILDLVGYGGGSTCFEGLATAPTLSNTTAAIRMNGGCQDNNQNIADFIEAAPTPRNSASPANTCGGPPPCPADFNGDTFVNPDDLSDFVTCFFLQVQFPGTCAAADFNADGFINPDDLSDFITTFFLAVQFGC